MQVALFYYISQHEIVEEEFRFRPASIGYFTFCGLINTDSAVLLFGIKILRCLGILLCGPFLKDFLQGMYLYTTSMRIFISCLRCSREILKVWPFGDGSWYYCCCESGHSVSTSSASHMSGVIHINNKVIRGGAKWVECIVNNSRLSIPSSTWVGDMQWNELL